MPTRFQTPRFSPNDDDGDVLPLATLDFFEKGSTTTRKGTFTTRDLGVANTNPVVADGDGRFVPIWLSGSYRVVLREADTDQVWDEDDMSGELLPNETSYELGRSGAGTASGSSHAGIIVGHIIKTNYRDSSRIAGSGSEVAFTGTTTAGKMSNWPDVDGFFYDADGKQFVIVGEVNVAKFGATGDGVTDDTVSLNIPFVMNNVAIILNAGRTYLTTGITASGDNILLVMNGATIKQAVLTSPDKAPIIDVQGNNFRIEDYGVLDGQKALQPADGFSDSFNGGTNGTGRYFRAAIGVDGTTFANTKITIRNVEFKDTYGGCVVCEGLDDVTVNDCFAKDCNFELAWVTVGVAASVIKRVRIQNNEIINMGSGDASVNANGMLVNDVESLIVTGNKITILERNMIKAEGVANTLISDNIIDTITVDNFAGIALARGINIIVSINTIISNNIILNTGAGITINTDDSDRIKITNNLIDTTTGSGTPDGIFVRANMNNLDISDNSCFSIIRHGIRVDTGSATKAQDLISIKNNILTGVKGTVTNRGISITVDDSFDINMLDISGNVLSDFRETLGSGWIDIDSVGANIAVLIIEGNKCFGDALARVLWSGDNFVTKGYVNNNYFDGLVRFVHSGVTFSQNNIVTGGIVVETINKTLTIASGVVTRVGPTHLVDTESAVSSDDLDTINGGQESDTLVLQAVSSARTIVVKDGTGNLRLEGDMSLDHLDDSISLIKRGVNWYETSRSNNGV